MDKYNADNWRLEVYDINQICDIFHMGKSKTLKLAQLGAIPVVKIGKSYFTTNDLIEKWFEDNEGKEIFIK